MDTTIRTDEIGSEDLPLRCTVAHRDGLPCGRRGVVAVTTTRGSSATMAVYCDGHRYMASPEAIRAQLRAAVWSQDADTDPDANLDAENLNRWRSVMERICAERARREVRS